MKLRPKHIALAAIGLLIAIQFLPVDRANPPVTGDIAAPPEVKQVLKNSCYDCHSHETRWPAYSYAAPISWLIAHDVEEGREHLNFSTWQALNASVQRHMKEEIWEEAEKGEMPLGLYVITHPGAKLSQDRKQILRVWTQENGLDHHGAEGND